MDKAVNPHSVSFTQNCFKCVFLCMCVNIHAFCNEIEKQTEKKTTPRNNHEYKCKINEKVEIFKTLVANDCVLFNISANNVLAPICPFKP